MRQTTNYVLYDGFYSYGVFATIDEAMDEADRLELRNPIVNPTLQPVNNGNEEGE